MKMPGSGAKQLAGLLAEQAANGGSGVVRAEHGKHLRLICIHAGAVVQVLSNVIEEQFHEVLVRRKLIGAEQVADALLQAKQRGMKPAAVIAANATLGDAELRKAMLEHLAELCVSTMQWDEAEFRFDRGTPDLSNDYTTPLPVADAVFRTAAVHPKHPGLLKVLLGRPNILPAVDEERLPLLDGAELPGPVAHLLERCDGRRRLAELLADSPFDEEQTMRTLYALTLLGCVRIDPVAATTAGDSPLGPLRRDEVEGLLIGRAAADHYGVLGIAEGASRDDVREAYYKLARRIHPDRFRSGDLQDMLVRVEAFFTRVTEAYNTLHDPDRRRDYDEAQRSEAPRTDGPADTRDLARENYLRGKALAERRRFTEAMKFLENAIEMDDLPVYRVELGALMGQNPRYRKEAEEHLSRALELDPTNVRGCLALGALLRRAERLDEALVLYERVLTYDPANAEASAAVAELSGGGRRRGIFG